jgi:hypothetical protein
VATLSRFESERRHYFLFFLRSVLLSLYRVFFKWKEKDIQLTAKSLDLTHPYFVSIKDLVFEKKQKLIIDPSQEDVLRNFGNSKHLMIPFQSVSMIEELGDEESSEIVRPFTLLEDDEKGTRKEENSE